MSNDRKVKIAFVGTGGMGQCAHLRNYAHIAECEVVALAELRPELGKKVAQRYDVPRAYTSHEEMIANEEIDAFVASHPFTRHGIILPELLRTGKPVFSEKPLAGSIEVGETITEAEKASGTFLMVGYHKRSDPATMYAKARIDEFNQTGELGKQTYVRLLMPPGDWIAAGFNEFIGSDEPMPEIQWDPSAEGLSPEGCQRFVEFVNYYIHQINLMRHLIGAPYNVTHVSPRDHLLVVEGENGVTGIIEMAPYQTTIDWQEHALVCFEKGYVRVDLPAPVAMNRPGRVEIMRDPGDGATPMTEAPTLPFVHAMRQQAVNFCKAVKGEMAPLCTAEEALEDLRNAMEYHQLRHG